MIRRGHECTKQRDNRLALLGESVVALMGRFSDGGSGPSAAHQKLSGLELHGVFVGRPSLLPIGAGAGQHSEKDNLEIVQEFSTDV